MIKTLLWSVLALGSVELLLAADVFTGSWKLDAAKSTFANDNPAPKELTLTFTEQDSNRTQILKGIAADGSATSTAWTSPMTGGTVKFTEGTGPNGGASVKLIDARTLMMTQNGTTGSSRIYQVSDDGKTLTLTQKNEDGRERARMVFSRRDP
jgi:hypothetical protein